MIAEAYTVCCTLHQVNKVWRALGYALVVFLLFHLAWLSSRYVFALATGTRYTTDQWSAAGGWISGIGAAAAVIIAVLQTRHALKQAEQARIDADAASAEANNRLMQELTEAERRHQDQLRQAEDAAQQAKSTADEIRLQDAKHHQELLEAEQQRHQNQIARLEKDARLRDERDLRQREFDATEMILKAIGQFVAAVHNHIRSIETSQQLSATLSTNGDITDADKTKYMLDSIYKTDAQQQDLLRVSNECIISTRLAMYQITNSAMRTAATSVLANMVASSRHFTAASADNDWAAAGTAADAANDAGRDLQSAALVRFEHADDNIPSPEAPISV